MDINQLPEDKTALAKLYHETVDHHREYLKKVQEAFHMKCDGIRDDAKAKLAETDESNEEARKTIAKDQKEQLDKTLAELKYAISRSNKEALKAIEAITEKIEAESLDLESALSEL